MSFCTYKIKNLDGEILKGKCWCSSREDLAQTFRDEGYYLVFYKESNSKSGFLNKKASLKELALLSGQLSSLLSAGIGIIEVIKIAREEITNNFLKKALIDIENMIRQGKELSNAMETYSNIFPRFMTNMVKAGEESGRIEEVLEKLSNYYNNEVNLKNKITKALIYPCAVFIVSIIVMPLLMIYIVPVFISAIGEMGGELPTSTKLLISISMFLKNNIAFFFLLLVSVIFSVIHYIKHDGSKVKFDKLLMKSLISRKTSQMVIAVQFSRTLSMLLSSGIQIVRAMDVTCAVIGNEYVKSEMKKSIDDIKKGAAISKSINKLNLFPEILCSMIRIGEESGLLDTMLLRSSKVMENELSNKIEKLTALIEPTVIIILSVSIGVVLMALVAPMFNVMTSI